MDEIYMQLALMLARKGEGSVSPNPLVGAVIVKNNRIIGMGYHEKYGENHAERNAIKNSFEDVEGSTIYVTLEPCAHYGKTPPCIDLIIEKKFKRVVIGMLDPNPLVAGKSIKKLQDNNIEITVGIKEKECRKLNEVFIKYITKKVPFVVLKSAMSLDGKIATSNGESKWITSSESRKDSHKLRNKYMGILVGINTVIQDNPRLNCRIDKDELNDYSNLLGYIKQYNLSVADGFELKFGKREVRNPIRIIVDSNLRIPMNSEVINDGGITIVGTVKGCNEGKKNKLESMGIKVIETESNYGKVNLTELIRKLGEEGIDSILIEGGGNINFSVLEEGIVDKVRFYIAPKIIGGEKSKSSIEGSGFLELDQSVELKNMEFEKIDKDFVITGYIS
ncbi:bifunctional diaminohydroxyphosphoribosylaminopyrimidine deaminase/5-amino-6-(5-phosphoribosylamino)uracil reductase RibD [Clostridium sp. SM-530-WT-3G]|uniref:bifunctional diaminohydroxyphosphoribosylaminopyrimidine deaminase/5-amino-6-(5-phosphoribosylamino)uracil reductase RibD n=1 Tax=Clostridium sp. SM-530-WT-3G TaxID=2725303 RepID=UPI00145FD05D|nr:bifunctional diaminohydroxyphosphoribosylaminopyrimidine deaminase/5-amino-6-(5-phosphoribosylamino)uracil reductase RibD [Clostridium sp. SM-530-WT-3G]